MTHCRKSYDQVPNMNCYCIVLTSLAACGYYWYRVPTEIAPVGGYLDANLWGMECLQREAVATIWHVRESDVRQHIERSVQGASITREPHELSDPRVCRLIEDVNVEWRIGEE